MSREDDAGRDDTGHEEDDAGRDDTGHEEEDAGRDDDWDDDPREPPHGPAGRPPSRRGVLVAAAGRAGRAVLVAAAAAGLVAGSGAAELPDVVLDLSGTRDAGVSSPAATGEPPRDPAVQRATLSCPGPDQLGLDDSSVADSPQTVQVSATSPPPALLPDDVRAALEGGSVASVGIEVTVTGEVPPGDPATGDPATSDPAAAVLRAEVSTDAGVVLHAQGDAAPGFAALQVFAQTDEVRRGLALVPCAEPVEEAWLLSGGGEPGRLERLVLLNPGGNAVTASVDVLGASGQLDAVGGEGIVVPPGDRVVVALDALAPAETVPAVRVRSHGGPLVPVLADRWREGTVDRGLELTSPVAAPGTDLVVPLGALPEGEADPGTAGAGLRVAVPGTSDAVVQVRALTDAGPVAVERAVLPVRALSTAEADLGPLPPGTRALQITSDAPVVAAAWVHRRSDPDGASDLAWFPATAPVQELAGTPLPPAAPGRAVRLVLASAGGAQVEVVLTAEGQEVSRTVVDLPPAGTAAVRAIEPATRVAAEEPVPDAVWLRPLSGTVHAALVATQQDDAGVLVAGAGLAELPVRREVLSVLPWAP